MDEVQHWLIFELDGPNFIVRDQSIFSNNHQHLATDIVCFYLEMYERESGESFCVSQPFIPLQSVSLWRNCLQELKVLS